MKIGVVTTSYPRFAGDAAGSFVAGHVAAMRALGHDVDVVAAGEPTDGVTRIPGGRLFYRGGAPDELERTGVGLAAGAFALRLAAAVTRRARRWDLIVAHWLAPSALAALASTAPLLAIAHGGDVHTLRRLGLLAPALAALRVRRARFAFVTDELLAIARGVTPGLDARDAIVQPMGLDVAHFAALARVAGPPTIVVVARLVPIKGVDVAIRAVADRHRLVIAGDGPDRARLEQLGGASFVGAVDAAARDELLRRATVVVVPSRILANGRTEGMPMIAVEALAAGVPVVASAVGGLRDLAGATLVPPDDPAALGAAIDTVLAAPPDSAMLRRGVAHLDWSWVATRLLAHAAARRGA